MKRIVLWISLLVCILSLGALSNSVSANPDTIIVTAQVPEDWTNVHLFAWVDDTTNLSAWPGTPMEKAADGRYILEIPAGYPNLIINNGESGIQTQDMSMDGVNDVWVVVFDTGESFFDYGYNGEVVYSDPGIIDDNVGFIPAPLTSMALVGEGDDELNWSPEDSTCEMTKVKDGVFSKDITLYKGTTIRFKLCGNDSWDSGYNLGGAVDGIIVTADSSVELAASVESMDLTYTATRDCILTVKLDMNGNSPKLTLTETSTPLPPLPGTRFVKIYVSVPEGTVPNLWAWGDNGDAFTMWPGETMTKVGDWWEIEIPDDCYYAIVNDGISQTYDLYITMGAENWIVVDETWSATVYTEEPGLREETTSYMDVHVRVQDGSTPSLWAWDSDTMRTVYDLWPGQTMIWDGEWWTLQVPNWADGFLVNDGGNANQTMDLSISNCNEFWIDVSKDWEATVYFTEPPEIATYTVYIRLPESWDAPYLYCLDSDDTQYPLTYDGQWWGGDLPVTVTEFLITDSYRQAVIPYFSIDSAVWLDILDNGNIDVSYENPGEREELTPEEPTKSEKPAKVKRKPQKSEETEESSSGWIILLVTGILVFAAVTSVVVVLIIKRKKKQNVVSGDEPPTNTLNNMEEK